MSSTAALADDVSASLTVDTSRYVVGGPLVIRWLQPQSTPSYQVLVNGLSVVQGQGVGPVVEELQRKLPPGSVTLTIRGLNPAGEVAFETSGRQIDLPLAAPRWRMGDEGVLEVLEPDPVLIFSAVAGATAYEIVQLVPDRQTIGTIVPPVPHEPTTADQTFLWPFDNGLEPGDRRVLSIEVEAALPDGRVFSSRSKELIVERLILATPRLLSPADDTEIAASVESVTLVWDHPLAEGTPPEDLQFDVRVQLEDGEPMTIYSGQSTQIAWTDFAPGMEASWFVRATVAGQESQSDTRQLRVERDLTADGGEPPYALSLFAGPAIQGFISADPDLAVGLTAGLAFSANLIRYEGFRMPLQFELGFGYRPLAPVVSGETLTPAQTQFGLGAYLMPTFRLASWFALPFRIGAEARFMFGTPTPLFDLAAGAGVGAKFIIPVSYILGQPLIFIIETQWMVGLLTPYDAEGVFDPYPWVWDIRLTHPLFSF